MTVALLDSLTHHGEIFDGTRTIVLEDTVFDREQNRQLPRRLTLSGFDRYGLPTSRDDDVRNLTAN